MPISADQRRLPRMDRSVQAHLLRGQFVIEEVWPGSVAGLNIFQDHRGVASVQPDVIRIPEYERHSISCGRRDLTLRAGTIESLSPSVDVDLTEFNVRYGTSIQDGDFLIDEETAAWRVDGYRRVGRRKFEVLSTREIVIDDRVWLVGELTRGTDSPDFPRLQFDRDGVPNFDDGVDSRRSFIGDRETAFQVRYYDSGYEVFTRRGSAILGSSPASHGPALNEELKNG